MIKKFLILLSLIMVLVGCSNPTNTDISYNKISPNKEETTDSQSSQQEENNDTPLENVTLENWRYNGNNLSLSDNFPTDIDLGEFSSFNDIKTKIKEYYNKLKILKITDNSLKSLVWDLSNLYKNNSVPKSIKGVLTNENFEGAEWDIILNTWHQITITPTSSILKEEGKNNLLVFFEYLDKIINPSPCKSHFFIEGNPMDTLTFYEKDTSLNSKNKLYGNQLIYYLWEFDFKNYDTSETSEIFSFTLYKNTIQFSIENNDDTLYITFKEEVL